MRKFLIILTIASVFGSCTEQGSQVTMSFKETEKSFVEPGKEFRPAPLWTWNARDTYSANMAWRVTSRS